MRRWTFDFDIDLLITHSEPASYWARPVNIDDGLEVIIWIRRLGGERLPTASYALRPNPNNFFFSPRSSSERRGVEIFRRLSFTHHPTKHLRSRYRINPRLTRFVSCRVRPMNIDGDLRNFMWIHRLGGERLLVMSYALYPNAKMPIFCHRRWIEIFCHLFSIHQQSNVIF